MYGYGLKDSYSSLYPIMNGRDPSGSSSEVPYEKGFQFLKYLEGLLGVDKFQQFLQAYVAKYHLMSITFLEMRLEFNSFVKQNFADKAQGIISQVDWEGWVQTPGANPPGNGLNFTTDEAVAFTAMADFYIENAG